MVKEPLFLNKQSAINFLLQTILPIAVFGGLGLGALAYWDSITRYTNLCNKVSYLKLDICLYIFWTQAYTQHHLELIE